MLYAVLASAFILLCAPLISLAVSGRPAFRSALDGFVLVSASGLVVLTLLPEAIALAGIIGLMLAILGFLIPWIAETLFGRSAEQTHRFVLTIAALAMILHAGADGLLLALAEERNDQLWITAGVLIHRLGVALTVWWLLLPVVGRFFSYLVLVLMVVMTAVFYGLTASAADLLDQWAVGLLQAFAAGSLLHVILHPVHQHADDNSVSEITGSGAFRQHRDQPHRAGTAIGVVLLFLTVGIHLTGHEGFVAIATTGGHGLSGADFVAGGHTNHDHIHSLDLLIFWGDQIGILLLCAVLLAPFLRRLMGAATIREAVTKMAAWSTAIWIAGSFVYGVAGGEEHFHLHDMPWVWLIWFFLVGTALTLEGARTFLGRMIPLSLAHHHHHSDPSP